MGIFIGGKRNNSHFLLDRISRLESSVKGLIESSNTNKEYSGSEFVRFQDSTTEFVLDGGRNYIIDISQTMGRFPLKLIVDVSRYKDVNNVVDAILNGKSFKAVEIKIDLLGRQNDITFDFINGDIIPLFSFKITKQTINPFGLEHNVLVLYLPEDDSEGHAILYGENVVYEFPN